MTLYDINAQLEALLEQVDPDTGELLCDMDQLEALSLERDRKLEGLALYIKNRDAEAKAIREEEKALADRRRSLERKAERAREFLSRMLAGEKFSTPRVAVSWRKSEAVEIGMSFFSADANKRFLRFKDPEPDKTAIKAALKAGEEITGAELVTNLNMSIK
jgi:hypothetical protein